MTKVLIIAEAGVNHNGDVECAKKMIDVAADAGVDIVKFQTFNSAQLVTRFACKAVYQKEATGESDTQLEMLKKLELSSDDHRILMRQCKKRRITFLSTPFDLDSVHMLHEMGITIFKVPSGEITNYPYLKTIAAFKKPVIVSTGMSTVGEIDDALRVLTDFGMERSGITLLHCNTEYPTPYHDVNLSSMLSVKQMFGVNVGYSDHTAGIEIPIAAVALGATVIEKHFTLDKQMKGPDHKASIDPQELRAMVSAIRHVELALGDGVKRVSPSERGNIEIVRKSIVARKDIKKGAKFSDKNLTVKRPGIGISPMKWNEYIGKTASRNYSQDDLIDQ